jgi:hypothetical protein
LLLAVKTWRLAKLGPLLGAAGEPMEARALGNKETRIEQLEEIKEK